MNPHEAYRTIKVLTSGGVRFESNLKLFIFLMVCYTTLGKAGKPKNPSSTNYTMTSYIDFNTVIAADFQGDHSESWGDKVNPVILDRVYKRYRAPISVDECEQMIADLQRIISGLEERYLGKVQSYKDLEVNIAADPAAKHDLKDAQSRTLRFKAILRAYTYWLNPGLEQTQSRVPSTKSDTPNRLDALFGLFVEFLGIYMDDLGERIDPNKAIESSQDIKDRLELMMLERQEKLKS